MRPEVEDARLGGYWGGLATMAWLQNRLHRCLLPAGESYPPESAELYSSPRWQLITIPAEELAGLRGTLQIRAEASIREGGEVLATEYAQVVTAVIEAPVFAEGELPIEIQRSIVAFESSGEQQAEPLANKLLASPTEGALRAAVRLFDNTDRTAQLWKVIENSPHQRLALDLMNQRIKETDLVPDYNLVLWLTGMHTRLLHPLEFDAADRQPYTEYHPEMEKESVDYFRSLLEALVKSSTTPGSRRADAIGEIIAGIAESDQCPLGTYGLNPNEAATLLKQLGK